MENEKQKPTYRPNVGLMIINQQGYVWLGKRADWKKFPFNEQMPQGGIDKGETPLKAAYRELWEETGLTKEKVKLLRQSEKYHKYRFPNPMVFKDGVYLGQRQKWFLFLFLGSDSDFNLTVHPEEIEFVSYKWYPADEIVERAVPFKRGVYARIIAEFQDTIQEVVKNASKI